MEVAPFFVSFHHFLSIFTIFYRFSRFTHFCRDLHFVAIYALFPQIFFGQNSLLRNITRFLHVCLCHPSSSAIRYPLSSVISPPSSSVIHHPLSSIILRHPLFVFCHRCLSSFIRPKQTFFITHWGVPTDHHDTV